MATITVKDVPDKLLRALKRAAAGERRSLNQQILRVLEQAVERGPLDRDAQLQAWRRLAGAWESDLSVEQETAQVISRRTPGRKVTL